MEQTFQIKDLKDGIRIIYRNDKEGYSFIVKKQQFKKEIRKWKHLL